MRDEDGALQLPPAGADEGAAPDEPARRLDDGEVEELLGQFEELLGRVEKVPGPTAEPAMEAISALAELYGEALARVVELADPVLVDKLAGDELVGHLLLLHGLHPQSVAERVGRALSEVKPYLGADGDAELTGIDAGVARIRLLASGCGSGEAAASVADVVLAEAPELAGVDPQTQRPPTTIAAESLFHRPDEAP
jgi:hypothetical protein